MDVKNEIAKDYVKLIRTIVDSYGVKRGTNKWENLYSAGLLGLTKAMNSFDSAKGELRHHLISGIHNGILDEIPREKRWENDVSMTYLEEPGAELPYEETIGHTMWEDEPLNLEELHLKDESMQEFMSKVCDVAKKLNPRELNVLRWNLLADDPVSYRAVAALHQCSRGSIQRDADRIRQLIKEKIHGHRD
jgi:RNA polymerase sigma factor (sigma-70 family)